MRILLSLVAFIIFSHLRISAGELFIVSWNVENLFDTVDDPKVEGDEEFTPEGPKKWDNERYNRKLRNLARVLTEMNDGKGPDIVGVSEIENRTVLKDLINAMERLKRNYKIVHQDSPSGRGIDTAIIYDADKVKLAKEQFHAVPVERKDTRDITEAEFLLNDKPFWVFMNHWPARSNPEENRIIAAKTLRKRVDELLEKDPKADFLLMGDFNDYPTNDSIVKNLRAVEEKESLPAGALYNTMWPIERAKRGTYVFRNKWEIIDHIIVSPGMLDDQHLTWKVTRESAFPYQIFTPKDDKQIPRPNRNFSGNIYHSAGISDHLPLVCIVQYR